MYGCLGQSYKALKVKPMAATECAQNAGHRLPLEGGNVSAQDRHVTVDFPAGMWFLFAFEKLVLAVSWVLMINRLTVSLGGGHLG